MLDLTDLSSGYGETQVLHGLSLRAEPGRVLAILGRNGAGKSTTLKTIMGLLPVRGGSVSFDGKPISGLAPYDIARRGIAYVPKPVTSSGRSACAKTLILPRGAFPARRAAGRWRG